MAGIKILALFLAFFAYCAGGANKSPAKGESAPQTEQASEPAGYASPEEFLRDFVQKVHLLYQREAQIDEQIKTAQKLAGIYIDLRYISQTALGRHWRKITSAQKEEFIKVFSDYLILTLLPQLKTYLAKGALQIRKSSQSEPDYYIIDSIYKFTDSSNKSVQLEWSIFYNKKSKSYKILNVNIAGINSILNWRGQVNSVIKREGMGQLIHKLKDKISQQRERIELEMAGEKP